MKILLVHEYYQSSSPSGENKVFEKEKELLEKNGLDVQTVTFKNDDIGTSNGPSILKTALYTPWSPIGKQLIKHAINNFKPDVIHFHNTFPVLSPAALVAAKEMDIATVQTFHNFRSVCAQAMLIKGNRICKKCIGAYPWPALIYRCYRHSLKATLPLVLSIALHRLRKTWIRKVDRFIVLSESNKDVFVQAGFPRERIRIKPNFFADPFKKKKNDILFDKGNYWIFIGRLKKEKGVQLLPTTWQLLREIAPRLRIVGDGPYRKKLENEIRRLGLRDKILLMGHCSTSLVQKTLRNASLLLLPSICLEGFPLVIGEAYAAGVPVAASRLGAPASIVKDGITGIHFEPGNPGDMAQRLEKLVSKPGILERMGKAARKEFERFYTAEKNYKTLMDIYHEAIEQNRHKAQKVDRVS